VTARPVVLIHGIQSGPSTWWRVGPDLTTLGFDVSAATVPGHDGTPATPEGTLASLAAAIPLDRPSAVVDPVALAVEVVEDARAARADPAEVSKAVAAGHPAWAPQDVVNAVRNRATVDDEHVADPLQGVHWDVGALAAAVRSPIALIAATRGESALDGPEREALIAAAERTVVVESGHSIHRDRPGVWVAVVAEAAARAFPSATGTPVA
jgi:pimeloyl-ACP methyl ester carboxylesterase